MISTDSIDFWAKWIGAYLRPAPAFIRESVDYYDLAIDTLLYINDRGITNPTSAEFRYSFNKILYAHQKGNFLLIDINRKAKEKRKFTKEGIAAIANAQKKYRESGPKFKCEGRTIDHCYYSPLGGKPIYFFK